MKKFLFFPLHLDTIKLALAKVTPNNMPNMPARHAAKKEVSTKKLKILFNEKCEKSKNLRMTLKVYKLFMESLQL